MSEVYVGATKTEQAKIVWNEIKAQINGSTFLKDKFKIANGRITHLKVKDLFGRYLKKMARMVMVLTSSVASSTNTMRTKHQKYMMSLYLVAERGHNH
jgi:hypothetical protein